MAIIDKKQDKAADSAAIRLTLSKEAEKEALQLALKAELHEGVRFRLSKPGQLAKLLQFASSSEQTDVRNSFRGFWRKLNHDSQSALIDLGIHPHVSQRYEDGLYRGQRIRPDAAIVPEKSKTSKERMIRGVKFSAETLGKSAKKEVVYRGQTVAH